MIDFEVRGAIFDVDDTLLDNLWRIPGRGLHERSRLAAVHEVGRLHDIKELQELSIEQNREAFVTAPVHTLEGAVWNILMMTGIADSEVMNPEHPLLKEISELKIAMHMEILREHGREVPGALRFVDALARSGLQGKLAVASMAVRQEVEAFFAMGGFGSYFPDERIVTRETVTHPKPHPEAFELAFGTLGLEDAERSYVCAFEDDPRGIMSAKAAGLYVCAITTRYDKQHLLDLEIAPDVVADSYDEFGEIFGLDMDAAA